MLTQTMPKTCCVYGLVDPRTKELFYVGCTQDLQRRLKEHSRSRERVKEIQRANRAVCLVILELNPVNRVQGDWPWIAFFTEKGIVLEQITERVSTKGQKRKAYRRKPYKPYK